MKTVPVQEAVGMVLCHDLTRIVPGEFKGRAFKKGHVVQEEDVQTLLEIGKEHLYVWEATEGRIHENEAASRIATAASGPGIRLTQASEGRINLIADRDGLLKINVQALNRINSIDEMVFGTLHTNQQVTKGRGVAGTRVVPLTIKQDKIEQVEEICRQVFPLVEVKPFLARSIGMVTTGSEIFKGLIKDKFGPVLEEKFNLLNSSILRQILTSDDREMTTKAIKDLVNEGAHMVVVTGGMSVDPDDQTPAAIRATGARVVTYGSPVFPGAMFMLAYLGDVPIVGLPGCVMYYKATIFELIIPRLMAGDPVTREDISALGHGGFCENCPECHYPACPFGKN
ncbi:putative molybdopterin biosynthesis protein moeA [Desulforapulum autotrophicum HRM2]|uniref:Molybdopterin molybdenumtransferase n=1 Tax=Desulforapulum autotrophicum (strain ATCC 43914 / DSM 3382 / VKM B-1955 / HRM2) TaxID=177437 RepID=C0QJ33_DESAH|nr:molybdopterin-binding protein [Desulforapulum autotrophicum]ACN13823.1 putative molybdopterin biosynthesis protein moeA [Desulforapulum autotrophicum HRM2]